MGRPGGGGTPCLQSLAGLQPPLQKRSPGGQLLPCAKPSKLKEDKMIIATTEVRNRNLDGLERIFPKASQRFIPNKKTALIAKTI